MTLGRKLHDAWDALGPRDRRALRIGGVAVAVALPLLVGLGVDDLLDARRAALAESRTLAENAQQRVAARLAAGAGLDASSGGAGSAALQAGVSRAAERAGLAGNVTVVQAVGDDRVQLVLRDAPFEAVTALLGSLVRWDGVTVVTADLTRSAPGRIEASFVLRGP